MTSSRAWSPLLPVNNFCPILLQSVEVLYQQGFAAGYLWAFQNQYSVLGSRFIEERIADMTDRVQAVVFCFDGATLGKTRLWQYSIMEGVGPFSIFS